MNTGSDLHAHLLDIVHALIPGVLCLAVFELHGVHDVAATHCRALDAAKAAFSFVTRWSGRTWIIVADEDQSVIEAVGRALDCPV